MEALYTFYVFIRLSIQGGYYALIEKKSIWKTLFKSIYKSHSFRLTSSHSTDYLISLRYYKKAISLVFSKSRPLKNNNKSGVAIYSSKKYFDQTSNYINNVKRNKAQLLIDRDLLGISGNSINKLILVINVTLLFPFIFLLSLILKRKGIVALVLLEYVENTMLLINLKEDNINQLYFYNATEKDAEYSAFILMQNKVHVTKIPSEGTLTKFYKTLVCNDFALTSAYQAEEVVEVLKSDDFYLDRYMIWPPTMILDNEVVFNNADIEKKNKDVIGFISAGVWRRRERNDFDIDDGHFESEDKVMELLVEFMKEHPEKTLFVYLHPCERTDEALFSRAIKFYEKYFNGVKIKFADSYKAKTNELFQYTNLTVCAYSNANFERLYCGYKTLFAPFCLKKFATEESSLWNIAATNKDDLFELILSSLKLSASEFFEQKGLNKYLKSNIEKQIHV